MMSKQQGMNSSHRLGPFFYTSFFFFFKWSCHRRHKSTLSYTNMENKFQYHDGNKWNHVIGYEWGSWSSVTFHRIEQKVSESLISTREFDKIKFAMVIVLRSSVICPELCWENWEKFKRCKSSYKHPENSR